MCNLILLRHLTEISMTKRVNDGIDKKMHWKDYFATILVDINYMLDVKCF